MLLLAANPTSGPPGTLITLLCKAFDKPCKSRRKRADRRIVLLLNGLPISFLITGPNTAIVYAPDTPGIISFTIVAHDRCTQILSTSARFTVIPVTSPSPVSPVIPVLPPTVESVTGQGGSTGPFRVGDTITIRGTGFLPGAVVSIGGGPNIDANVVSSTILTFVLPPDSPSIPNSSVVVVNPDGQSSQINANSTIDVLINLVQANIGADNTLTVVATNFTIGEEVKIEVTNDDDSITTQFSATPTNATTVTIPTDLPPGNYTVVAIGPTGQSNSIPVTEAQPPTVTSVAGARSPVQVGDTVTVTGTGFVPNSIDTTVTVRVVMDESPFETTIVLPAIVQNSNTLTFQVPSNASPVLNSPIVVTNPDGQVSAINDESVINVLINLISAASDGTITATNFYSGQQIAFDIKNSGGVTVANVLGVPNSSTSVTVEIPNTLASGTYSIVAVQGASNASNEIELIVVSPPPTVTQVSASIASPYPVRTTVTVTGTGFFPGATVQIGGGDPIPTSVASFTELTFVIPDNASPLIDSSVIVTNLDGQSSAVNDASVINVLINLTSATPINLDGTDENASTTVTATNLPVGIPVTFVITNGISEYQLDEVTPTSSTSVVVPVDASNIPPGTYQIYIIANDQSNASTPVELIVYPPPAPTVSSVSGSLVGTSATVTGTGFIQGATVSVLLADGTTSQVSTMVQDSTTLTFTIPNNASPLVDSPISVTNPDGQSSAPNEASVLNVLINLTFANSDGTITGTNFYPGQEIVFDIKDDGGMLVATVTGTPDSTTSVAVDIPTTLESGAYTIVARESDSPNALNASNEIDLTVVAPAPTVAGVSATSSSPYFVGTTITVTGTGFFPGATVQIDGSDPISTNLVSSSELTFVIPDNASPLIDSSVVVTNTDGQSSTVNSESVINVLINLVSATPINLNGSDGADEVGSTTVTATNLPVGTPIQFIITNGTTQYLSNEVTPTSPTSVVVFIDISGITPGTYQIAVVANDQSNASTPIELIINPAPPPTVASVTGSRVGTTATITGTGFVQGATVSILLADGTIDQVSTTVQDSTMLTFIIPDNASPLVDSPIGVTNPDGQSSDPNEASVINVNTNLVSATQITPSPSDTVYSVDVVATNFPQGTLLTFNVKMGVIVYTSDPRPPESTTLAFVDIYQLLEAGTYTIAAAGSALYNSSNDVPLVITEPPSPTVTAIYSTDPTRVDAPGPFAVGTILTVEGNNFVDEATVMLGNAPPMQTTFVSSTQLTFTIPDDTAPGADIPITIVNPNGQSSSPPAVIDIPINLVAATTVTEGVESVTTITATNLPVGSSVQFNTTTTDGTLVQSQVVVPTNINEVDIDVPDIRGTYLVTAVYQGISSNSVQLIVNPPPPPTIISVVGPNGLVAPGPFAVNDTLTVTGENFVTGATVVIPTADGSTTNVATNVQSSTVLTFTIPENALPGSTTFVVVGPDGQSSAPSPPIDIRINLVTATDGTEGVGNVSTTVTSTNFPVDQSVQFLIRDLQGNLLRDINQPPTSTTSTTLATGLPQGEYTIVANFGGTSSNAIFLTVLPLPPPPTIVEIRDPNGGYGPFTLNGTILYLHGTNLQSGTTVQVTDQQGNLVNAQVNGFFPDEQLIAFTPPSSTVAGPNSLVYVTNPTGQMSEAFPMPVNFNITSVVINNVIGNATATFNGTNFPLNTPIQVILTDGASNTTIIPTTTSSTGTATIPLVGLSTDGYLATLNYLGVSSNTVYVGPPEQMPPTINFFQNGMSSGPFSAGQLIDVGGTNFGVGARVEIRASDGSTLTPVTTYVSQFLVRFTIPSNALVSPNTPISVVNLDGQRSTQFLTTINIVASG